MTSNISNAYPKISVNRCIILAPPNRLILARLKILKQLITNIENKIKYNESIIRYLFISVKEHVGDESYLFSESKSKKKDSDEESEDQTSQTEEQIVEENTDNDSVEGNEVEENAEKEQEEEVKDE